MAGQSENTKKVMRAALDALGDEALPKLSEKGIAPADVAIALVGGVTAVAKLWGIHRTDYFRKKDPNQWTGEQLKLLKDASGIPVELLLMSADEYQAQVAAKRKKIESSRAKLGVTR